ncbi:hypothetical protein RCL1_002406 [Eukaryota sp. TZLM3-RCL]
MYSNGEMHYENGKRTFEFSTIDKYLLSFHSFFLIWGIVLIFGVVTAAIGATIGDWYMSSGSLNNFVFFSKLKQVIFYNLGSIAMGALFVALLAALRLVLKFLVARAQTFNRNRSVGCVYKSLLCFVTIVEKIMRYINRHALIIVGVRNLSYSESSSKAMELLVANMRRALVLSILTEVLLLFCKITIGLFTGWIVSIRMGDHIFSGYEGVVITGFLLGFIVSTIITQVFLVVTDSIFLNFLLEEQEQTFGVMSRRGISYKNTIETLVPEEEQVISTATM